MGNYQRRRIIAAAAVAIGLLTIVGIISAAVVRTSSSSQSSTTNSHKVDDGGSASIVVSTTPAPPSLSPAPSHSDNNSSLTKEPSLRPSSSSGTEQPSPVVVSPVETAKPQTSKPTIGPAQQSSTMKPRMRPTKRPSEKPSTSSPTKQPTTSPTLQPSPLPTPPPTVRLTTSPTKSPTLSPTTAQETTNTLKVFLMMGQSNMVGTGVVGSVDQKGTLKYITQTEKKYPHLVGSNGEWTKRDDVSFVFKNSFSERKSPLTVGLGMGPKFIGPELQIGHTLGDALDQHVLLLKVGVGNRALGFDLLPPGVTQYPFTDLIFAGYGQCPPSWKEREGPDASCPEFYAGFQYDRDLANAKSVLENLSDYVPGYDNTKGFEIAGFFFWQGHKDTGRYGWAENYSNNLDSYIKSIRQDYSEYRGQSAPFVVGSIGFSGCDESKWDVKSTQIWQAQMGVRSENNVKTVDTRSFWRSAKDSPSYEPEHYHRNANVYLEAGTSMGAAMVDLLKGTNTSFDYPTC